MRENIYSFPLFDLKNLIASVAQGFAISYDQARLIISIFKWFFFKKFAKKHSQVAKPNFRPSKKIRMGPKLSRFSSNQNGLAQNIIWLETITNS